MIKVKEEWLKDTGKYECPHCKKQFTLKGISTHIFRKHTDRGLSMKSNFIKYNENKDSAWNKGLTKETSDSLKKQSDTFRRRYKEGKYPNVHNIAKWSLDNPELHKLNTSLGGRKSVALQGKRSKNEVLFYDMCKAYFKDVKHNKPMFNGWDADIIIEDIKVAVLWNGKWHYEKIMEGHNLEQVQARDKIKLHEIKNYGYKAYIIKDMGKYNPIFVKEEFDKFIHSTA